MSWGGAGQRSAYGLHKIISCPPGPRVVQEPPRSGSQTTRVFDGTKNDPDAVLDAERIKQFIQRVNNLRDPKLNVHTTHLLMFVFPIVGDGVDTLHARLSVWKGHFKEQMNEKGLADALKKMGFQVSEDVPKLLMSAFQTCDPNQLSTIHNIDYNYFIQCCIFAEKNFKKKDGSTSSSASSPAQQVRQPTAKQDVGQNKQPKNIPIG